MISNDLEWLILAVRNEIVGAWKSHFIIDQANTRLSPDKPFKGTDRDESWDKEPLEVPLFLIIFTIFEFNNFSRIILGE